MPALTDAQELELTKLLDELDLAERDIIADYGEEVADAGGVYETWQNVLVCATDYDSIVVAEAARIRGVFLP